MTTTPWGLLDQAGRDGPSSDKILDAAWDCFTSVGIGATTVRQIATQAGISRVWLYQHFENRDAVVRALIRREVKRFLTGLAGSLDDQSDPEQILGDAAVYTVRFLRSHQLLRRVLESEPQVILPFLTVDAGPLFAMAAEWAASFLQSKTSMDSISCTCTAEILVRLVASTVLTPHVTLHIDDDSLVRALAVALVRAIGDSISPTRGQASVEAPRPGTAGPAVRVERAPWS